MASGNNGSILGGFKGTVGTVVLSSWKSLSTMRSKIGVFGKKKLTAKQLTQTEILRIVSDFLSAASLKSIIKLGYQQPKYPVMTHMNTAVSYHMKNAIVGDVTDLYFDLNKLKLSKPIRTTQQVWNPVLESGAERTIKISWELNPYPLKTTQLDDKVILVFYNKDLNHFQVRSQTKRDDLSYTYAATNRNKEGNEVYCYMMLTSTDEKLVSESEFLGTVQIIA